MSSKMVRSFVLLTALAMAWVGGGVASHQAWAQTAVSEAAHQQFVFAYRLLQRGDRALAIEAFDEYLGKFPRDEKRGDALYFRALLARQQGQLQEAMRHLETDAPAPILVPVSARGLLMGEVALELGQFDKALAALEPLKPDDLEPTLRATTHFLRGQAHRGLGHGESAVTHFGHAAEVDSPLRPRALLELAHALSQQNKLPQAIQAARSAATAGDADISPQAARTAGDLAYRAGQFAEAVDYYQLVLTNYASSSQVGPAVVSMMWALLETRQYDRLLTRFKEYQDRLSPSQRVTAWYLAGSAHQELGDHAQAVSQLESLALGSAGSNVEDKALYKLAYSQAELGQYAQALATVQSLREKHPRSPRLIDAQFLLASLDARRGDLPGAIARATALADQGDDKPHYAQALLLRAQLHDKAAQPDLAAKDYAAYLASTTPKPDGTPPATTQSARQEAALRLLDIDFRQGRFDNVLKTAATLLAMPDLPTPMRQQALLRQALAQVRLNKLEPADAAFTQLLTLTPPPPMAAQAVYYRGLTRMALKKTDAALADFVQAADAADLPATLKINALKLLSIHQRQQNQPQPALQTLTQLEKLTGITGLSADELLWLGEHHLAHAQAAPSLKYLRPLIARQVETQPAQRTAAIGLAARALRAVNDLPAAINAYQEAIAADHATPGLLRLELAATLAQAGRADDAIDEYHGLINATQSALAARALFELATLHRTQAHAHQHAGDTVSARAARLEARKLLKRLVLLYAFPELSPLPQNSQVVLAELALEMDQPDEALAEWRDLAQRHPDTPYAHYAQAASLAVQGKQRDKATAALRKLGQDSSLDPVLSAAAAARLKAVEGQP